MVIYNNKQTVKILNDAAFLGFAVNRGLKAYENHHQDKCFTLERQNNIIIITIEGKKPIQVDLDVLRHSSKHYSFSRIWQKLRGTFFHHRYENRLESFVKAIPSSKSFSNSKSAESFSIDRNDSPLKGTDICVLIEDDSRNSNVTGRHRTAYEDKIYQTLSQNDDANPITLNINNQKLEFYKIECRLNFGNCAKFYLQVDEMGVNKIIIITDRADALELSKDYNVEFSAMPQVVRKTGSATHEIHHLGIKATREANVDNFKPLRLDDLNFYHYIPTIIQANQVTAQNDDALTQGGLCIYIEDESQGSGIASRKRNAKEEAIYQAIKDLNTKPYSIVQEEDEVYYYVLTDGMEHSHSTFYLQIAQSTGATKIIKSSFRYQTSDDLEVNESLKGIRDKFPVNLHYTLNETGQTTHIYKSTPIKNFSLDDLIQPSMRASLEFKQFIEKQLRDLSDKSCTIQAGCETIIVQCEDTKKAWDKDNFLLQIPLLGDSYETGPLNLKELYPEITNQGMQFFTTYIDKLDEPGLYQTMTEAILVRAYKFAIKSGIPRMELLIADEINQRLMNNTWKNKKHLEPFRSHGGIGKIISLYYPDN